MILDEAYNELRRQELVTSQVDFSTRWLNKSERYMSMMRATDREPSVDTLARLAANIKAHYDTFRESRFVYLQQRADEIRPILQKVNKALLQEAMKYSDWPRIT